MEPLTGNEEFTLHGTNTGILIKDFWSWAYSDLIVNTQRGVMAEFLVYSSLSNVPLNTQLRENWLPFDVTSPSGRRIEVKSAAYIQAWTPENIFAQIRFDIGKKLAWDNETAAYASEPKRNCDLYVFCLFTAKTKDVSILNLDYWDFYVLPTSVLDKKIPEQSGISLSSLLKLDPVKTDYDGLGAVIESIKL
ncbi:MAG: hypothetical protein HFI99_17375 [Lachnospiraceae bacterium]|jgi:hypothetical protein|nr:hypothetical protein [Lachnospiraceae bacterium]